MNFKLEFSEKELNIIINAIAKEPLVNVYEVFNKISKEVENQNNKQNDTNKTN